MKRWLLSIVCGVLLLSGAGLGLWVATMPYSLKHWWNARSDVRYSNTWPISLGEYDKVMGVVEEKLGWREIPYYVEVDGSEEVVVYTLVKAEDTWGWGREFVVRKLGTRWHVVRQNRRVMIHTR